MKVYISVSDCRAARAVVSSADSIQLASGTSTNDEMTLEWADSQTTPVYVDVQVYGATTNLTRVSLLVEGGFASENADHICRDSIDGDYTCTWQLSRGTNESISIHEWPPLAEFPAGYASSEFEAFASPGVVRRVRAAQSLRDSGTGLESPTGESVLVRVMYGTNRLTNTIGVNVKHTNDRSKELHVGMCEVSIPFGRRTGEIDPPFWRRLLGDTSIRVSSDEALSRDEFVTRLVELLGQSAAERPQSLLFVHGYNCSFNGAVRRAAQLWYDGRIRGAVSVFSWPSQDSRFEYAADEAASEAAERSLDEFLTLLLQARIEQDVTIVAHSMGCRAVTRVLAARAKRGDGEGIGRVILAAPDIDSDLFVNLSTAFSSLAKRPLVYASSKDFPLGLSFLFHAGPRAGFAPPVCVAPHFDTVFCKDVDPTFMAHSYFATSRILLSDLRLSLLGYGTESSERGLQESESGGYYLLPA